MRPSGASAHQGYTQGHFNMNDYQIRRKAHPLPAIVEEALRRMREGQDLRVATVWVRNDADTDARLAVDDWMRATGCSLLNVPGRERRFMLLVDSEHETSKNEIAEIHVGRELFCNGYPGKVAEICTGQLKGMAVVRLASGEVCVSLYELNRFRDYDVSKHKRSNGHQVDCFCDSCRAIDAEAV
jgi:hypothetical protein